MVLAAILLALLIVLSRFLSIKTPVLVISFAYVPIMMAAILLGPKYSTLIAALGDLIGAILFPFGTYFPGFTISAGLSGLIYGIFLYQKTNEQINSKTFLMKLIISNLLVLGIIEIFLVSFWIKLLYDKAYLLVLADRVLAQVIMFPIRIISIFALTKFLQPFLNQYLYEE